MNLFAITRGLILAFTLGAWSGTVAAQECADVPAEIISWWTGDDTADDMSGSNHGSLQNGASFGTGLVLAGFSLDGIDDHVLVPDSPSLNTSALSIEGWIQTSEINSLFIGFLLAKSNANGLGGYEFGIASGDDGRARFTLNGGEAGADLFGYSNLIDGQWHHVAATYDGAFMKIFVNGNLEARRRTSVVPNYDVDAPLYIGYRQFSGDTGRFSGLIDELSLYGRALCRAEIEVLYEAGAQGKCAGGRIVPECPFFEDGFGL